MVGVAVVVCLYRKCDFCDSWVDLDPEKEGHIDGWWFDEENGVLFWVCPVCGMANEHVVGECDEDD